MRRTPALAHRVWKLRLKLRGSIGVPHLVLNTRPRSCQAGLALSMARSCSSRRSLRAARQISGSGKYWLILQFWSLNAAVHRGFAQLLADVKLSSAGSYVGQGQTQHL